jgi:hypothetical protein
MDLNTWSPEDHHVRAGQLVLMQLGAKPYRCEYCRINFVSFRGRKEKFSFKRWRRYRKYEADTRAATAVQESSEAEEGAGEDCPKRNGSK